VETRFGVPLADPTLRSEAAPSVAVQRLLAGGGRGAAPPDGNAAPEAADQQALLHSQRARASEPAQRGAPSR
jgi:hypothetical protein